MLIQPKAPYLPRKKGNTSHTYHGKSNKKTNVENETLRITRVYDSQGVESENNQKKTEELPKPYFHQTERKQMSVPDPELPGFSSNV